MKKIIYSKIKKYPDGSQKITIFKDGLSVHCDNDKKSSGLEVPETRTLEEIEEERQRVLNKRFRETRNKIQDYALCNEFTHFWNLTQDAKIVGDRSSDEIALANLQRFLKSTRTHAQRKNIDFGYLILPERHKTGELHFHGFTYGYPYDLKDSSHKWQGKKVFNCEQWKYGFSNVTEISDKVKAANYVTKYITKGLMAQNLGKGKKKYWCSKGLKLPDIEYLDKSINLEVEPDWVSPDGNIEIYNIKEIERE